MRTGTKSELVLGNGVSLSGYAHGFDFGTSASNRTIGRYVISSGAEHFVPQAANTLGAANSGPLVGPVVISEIHYHPLDISSNAIGFNNFQDEFIELRNISASPVALYDPAHRTNTWHLREAVSFDFPTNVSIAAGGSILVVGFNPSDTTALNSFRAHNAVPAGVPIYGPWSGNLDNDAGPLELRSTEAPNPTNVNDVAYALLERISYLDHVPWPAGADGFGPSLQRIVSSSYGNDPTNWIAAAATPVPTLFRAALRPRLRASLGIS